MISLTSVIVFIFALFYELVSKSNQYVLEPQEQSSYIWAARLFLVQVVRVACRQWGSLCDGRYCLLISDGRVFTLTHFFLDRLAFDFLLSSFLTI